jgi:hypothetical protein
VGSDKSESEKSRPMTDTGRIFGKRYRSSIVSDQGKRGATGYRWYLLERRFVTGMGAIALHRLCNYAASAPNYGAFTFTLCASPAGSSGGISHGKE